MKDHEVGRRRFLALCGGGVAGIWLAGTGFVRLPAQMVFAMSGSCSFCGREGREVFGLAGIMERSVRVCDECIALCFDIIAEEAGIEPPRGTPTEVDEDPLEGVFKDSQLLEELFRRIAGGERGDPLIDALLKGIARAEEVVIQPAFRPRTEDLACSFCDKNQRDVVKLIAGPTVFICDGCIGDAGALFMRYGWRPEV